MPTKIQPLSMKALGALARGVQYLFWSFLPVAREQMGLGTNFLRRTTRA